MNELLTSGAEAISQAEEELRRLLGRAAEVGDYDSLLVLTEWAKVLRGLLEVDGSEGPRPPAAGQPSLQAEASTGPESLPPSPAASRARPAQGRPHKPKGKRKSRTARSKRRLSSRPREYPKFLREGDNLVKIGWSKRDRAPYEHKAPRRVVDLLVEALLRVGKGGRRFTSDVVFPLRDEKEGVEVPSYQSYLALAWLRAEELVVQHGRQGYSLPPLDDLPRATEERWKELAER